MAERSSIEWTDATWNPWQGCTKVSPACKHCYMFRDLARYGKDPSVVRRSAEGTFRLPLKRGRDGQFKIPPGSKVFTCSWSDWFHADADPWRDEAWDIIRQRPDVIFQIVTKRTERIAEHLPQDWGDGWPHVWLLATVENQEWADKRISELLAVPTLTRGLSIEPLLGPVDLGLMGTVPKAISPRYRLTYEFIDWVIAGGESGPGARPMNPAWPRSLRDQCQAAGVPFFFKQWGEHSAEFVDGTEVELESLAANQCVAMGDGDTNHVRFTRVGKKAAGRELDGRTWDEFPVQTFRAIC